MPIIHDCHLDFPYFADELDAVVARAKAAGVGRERAEVVVGPAAGDRAGLGEAVAGEDALERKLLGVRGG